MKNRKVNCFEKKIHGFEFSFLDAINFQINQNLSCRNILNETKRKKAKGFNSIIHDVRDTV